MSPIIGETWSAGTLTPEQWSVGPNVFFDPTPYVVAAAIVMAVIWLLVYVGRRVG